MFLSQFPAAELVMTEKYHKLIVDCMTSETAASGGWQHVNQAASAAMLKEAAGQASQIRGEYHRSEKPGECNVLRASI